MAGEANGVFGIVRGGAASSRSNEVALESFQAETAVRDMLARYVRALNQGDVDAMMRFFTDDCVLTSPSGTLVGSDAIRADLVARILDVPRSFHLWPNIVVRLSAELDEADTTAYFYAMLLPKNAPPRSVGGLVADQVVRRNGGWRINERSTNADLTAVVADQVGPAAPEIPGSRGAHG